MNSVERNEIEEYRAALVQLIMSPEARFLARQRDAFNVLLPEIKTAKEKGVGFEQIAEFLQKRGHRLKAATIQEFYPVRRKTPPFRAGI